MRKWIPQHIFLLKLSGKLFTRLRFRGFLQQVMNLAHVTPVAGHLGDKTLAYFFWHSLCQDASQLYKSCHACQVVGEPCHIISPAPLKPIPAFEKPFSRVSTDCVGPLSRSKFGNQYR